MLKAGLTGSIAVGKSFVCGVFEELGCHVLDADQTAREVVEPKTLGLGLIVENFGESILQKNGQLDRKKLGELVFADESKRQLLNSLVHPLVKDKQDRWLKEKEIESPEGIAIVDAALMIESGGHTRFDKLIVVWCKPDIQLQRLMLRDKLSRKSALKRIESQMPQEEKMKFSDYLIETTDGFEATREQVEKVYFELKELAAE
ncbi:MAG: dephospho-CoA kinase [Pyrinomonadaceae bacterium]|nr:dephospho-CoA kinase [Pyrinomonadaceae bacterium]